MGNTACEYFLTTVCLCGAAVGVNNYICSVDSRRASAGGCEHSIAFFKKACTATILYCKYYVRTVYVGMLLISK